MIVSYVNSFFSFCSYCNPICDFVHREGGRGVFKIEELGLGEEEY